MARTIICDAPACNEVAAWMLTAIDNGSTQGLCGPHFLVMCAGMIARASGDELDAETVAALARLGGMQERTNADDPLREVYTCSACGAEFESEETITQHIYDVHAVPDEGDGNGERVAETAAAE